MIHRLSLPLFIVVALVAGIVFAGGCGSSGGPDSQQQVKGIETAKTLRSYFDKAGGNYDSLDEVDKAAYVQLSGGEEKAKQNWELMKFGPGAADRSGQTPPADGEVGR